MADQNHKITLVFIINGQNTPVGANVEVPLAVAVQHALKESGNAARGAEEWEVRDSTGVLLDQSRKIKDLDLKDNARLFLSLRVGAGGNETRP